jgi:Domain of unknown function (DUF927)
VDTREFLASVIPWDAVATGGYATIHWQRPDQKWPGRSCRTLDDLLRVVADVKAPNCNNVFFCTSVQRENGGSRRARNALASCILFTDSDVDPDDPKKYPSLDHAIADILHFCQLLGIPKPSIMVASGGGLHCYWLSDKTLKIEDWRPFAEGLKAAAMASNVKIDVAVTADVVRILRVPGTTNYKYDPPQPVRILQKFTNGQRHDFATVMAPVLEFAPVERRGSPRPIHIAEAFQHLGAPTIGEGIEVRHAPPLPFGPIKDECGWLREAYETGGEKFTNFQWNLTTLCATWLEDGNDIAHRLANKYPRYRYEQTQALWDRKNRERRDNPEIGWPKCRTIEGSGSKHCASCVHLARDQSPLHIGLRAIGPTARAQAEIQEIEALGGKIPPELRLPEGYCVDEKNRICKYVATEIGTRGKVVPGRLIMLLKSQVTHPSFLCKESQYGISFIVAVERGKTWEVFLRSSDMAKGKLHPFMLTKMVLHNHEVMPMIEKFAQSWLDKLRVEDAAVHDTGHMGWRYREGERIGFAAGNVLYCSDGVETQMRTAGEDEFRSWYVPTGKREPWLKACKLLTDRKRPELDILIATAFAAPLMTFAGTLYGATLSIYGDPGTSKSTGQQVAASVYGSPKQTRESLNSTPKSVLGRLGRTRNLPGFWDDIQDEKHQESLFQAMFVASEGTEGGRLNPDATMKARLEWQTLLVVCSNASFVDFLANKQKSTTAGMRRVFEIAFYKRDNEPGMINPVDAGDVFQELNHNYGVVGAEYARILANEHNELATLVKEATKRFCLQVQGRNDENYWWGMCGTLLVGAALANRLGAELDLKVMEEFLIEAFYENRRLRSTEGTEGGSYENTEQSLVAFLNFYVGNENAIWVKQMYVDRGTNVGDLRTPKFAKPLYVQIVRDDRCIQISKRALREWLHQNNINPRGVFEGLAKFFKAKARRISLGAGTVFAQSQEWCFEITIVPGQHAVLEELVTAQGDAPNANPVT